MFHPVTTEFDNSTSLKTLRYIFTSPLDINGTYTFNYSTIDTANAFPSINYGSVVFTLEFIGYI